MICYRAETAVADILQQYLSRANEEKRMLVKQIINTQQIYCPIIKIKHLLLCFTHYRHHDLMQPLKK
jgi:hypothetical protein